MNFVKKYIQLSVRDKILLIEATFLCLFIKFIVITLPIRWYSYLLGKQHIESEASISEQFSHIIFKISQAIIHTRKIIPWKSQCLTEAITAKIMLRNRGLISTLYLGVNKKEDRMVAHAWLRCGNIYVTGRKGMNKFVVLSSFS